MKSKSIPYESLFRALGDPHRLEILDLLDKNDRNAGELLERIDVVQSTLSHHMKTLCDAGLVTARKSGKWTVYTLNRQMLKNAAAYFDAFLMEEAEKKSREASYKDVWEDERTGEKPDQKTAEKLREKPDQKAAEEIRKEPEEGTVKQPAKEAGGKTGKKKGGKCGKKQKDGSGGKKSKEKPETGEKKKPDDNKDKKDRKKSGRKKEEWQKKKKK